MARISEKKKSDALYRAILQLRTEEEVYDFFQDLCTVTELRSMEQRFEVALMLHDGATISRVNRSLNQGSRGYQVYFDRTAGEGRP